MRPQPVVMFALGRTEQDRAEPMCVWEWPKALFVVGWDGRRRLGVTFWRRSQSSPADGEPGATQRPKQALPNNVR